MQDVLELRQNQFWDEQIVKDAYKITDLPETSGPCDKMVWKRVGIVRTTSTIRDMDDMSCIICYGDYETDELLEELSCGHYFHHYCIHAWLRENLETLRCPKCTKELLLKLKLPEDADGEVGVFEQGASS